MNPFFRFLNFLTETPRSIRWGIAWAYCILLIYLLITPSPLAPFGETGNETEQAIDRTLSSYLQHVIAYCVLVCLFWWSSVPQSARSYALLIGGSCAHAVVFECLQYFVPSRYCDGPDLFCNLAGVALGAGVMKMLSFLGASTFFHNLPMTDRSRTLPNSIPLESGE